MSEPSDAGAPEMQAADAAQIDQATRECERELARVGVTWQSLENALRERLAVATPQYMELTVGLDARALLAVLRALGDRAGLPAVLGALDRGDGSRPPAS